MYFHVLVNPAASSYRASLMSQILIALVGHITVVHFACRNSASGGSASEWRPLSQLTQMKSQMDVIHKAIPAYAIEGNKWLRSKATRIARGRGAVVLVVNSRARNDGSPPVARQDRHTVK